MKTMSQCLRYSDCFETLDEARAEIERLHQLAFKRPSPPMKTLQEAAEGVLRKLRDAAYVHFNGDQPPSDATAIILAELAPAAPTDAEKAITENMAEAFLRWPLTDSVCADLCATKQGPGRVGTNLLTFTEAKQMFREVVVPNLPEMDKELIHALEMENTAAWTENEKLKSALSQAQLERDEAKKAFDDNVRHTTVLATEWERKANNQLTALRTRVAELDKEVDRQKAARKSETDWWDAERDQSKQITALRAQVSTLTGALEKTKKYQSRLEWLHTGAGRDADGCEWGVFRVKWDSRGRPVEVWQTLSDFTDLDAEILGEARSLAGEEQKG